MKRLIGCGVVAMMLASGVMAQESPFSASGAPAFNGIATTPGTLADEYMHDDGSAEDALGLTAGGVVVWLARFQVTQGNETVTSLSAAFGSPGCTSPPCGENGRPFGIGLWSDPNQDGNPSDGAFLAKAASVQSGVDNNEFVTVDIPDTNVGAVGNRFFVVVWTRNEVRGQPGDFPAALDQAQTSQGRAWVTGQNGAQFDPNQFGTTVGWFDVDAINFPGLWLVRASTSGGGGGCQYALSANPKPKKGCNVCPSRGDVIGSGQDCEEVKDCDKKLVIKKLDCPDGGPGFCKKVKGKRDSCL